MTDDMTSLRALVEKFYDADLLGQIFGLAGYDPRRGKLKGAQSTPPVEAVSRTRYARCYRIGVDRSVEAA